MYTNEDFFQVFGHISVFLATLDFLVTTTMLRLVQKDKRVRDLAMNDRTTLQQKLCLLDRLQDHQVVDAPLLGEIKSILPRAFTIREKRNRFVHDLWKFAPEDVRAGRITRFRIQGLNSWAPKVVRDEETTIEGLYSFLQEIGELQKEFGRFYKRLPQLSG
jgi:hypothetical protein